MIDIFDPMIIVPASLSVIVLVRLISVLGQKSGAEQHTPEETTTTLLKGSNGNGNNVIHVIDDKLAPETADEKTEEETDPISLAIGKITEIDKRFNREDFLKGAELAYETVLSAFARGDLETLKSILSSTVYKGFVESINRRSELGYTMESVIVNINEGEITAVNIENTIARISLRFVCSVISSTKSKDGSVVAGNPHKQEEVVDHWTFERLLTSPNPNWTLISTASPAAKKSAT